MPVEFSIGRKSSMDIYVGDKLADDKHAVLEVHDSGEIWLRDLGSRFGTLVNGKPAAFIRLFPGDKLQIGFTQIEWEKLSQVRLKPVIEKPIVSEPLVKPVRDDSPKQDKNKEATSPENSPVMLPSAITQKKEPLLSRLVANPFTLLFLILVAMLIAGWLIADFIH